MADNVSKATALIGWVLLGFLAIAVGIGALYVIWLLFVSVGIPPWLKLLLGVGIIGGGFLIFSVVRDRWQEHKTDKYKDIEV